MKRNLFISGLILLLFITILIVFNYLPHYPVTFFSRVFVVLYFIAALVAFNIFLKDKYNPYISFNFGLYFLYSSLIFITRYVGDELLFGNDYIAVYIYQYMFIFQKILFTLSFIFIAVKYVFRDYKTYLLYLISISIVVVVTLINYNNFLFDYRIIIKEGSYRPLFISSIKFYSFNIAFLILYWYIYYKTDIPIGGYINSIMFVTSIHIPVEILHLSVFSFNWTEYFSLGQYWSFFILVFFLINFIFRLSFVTKPFGIFYEHSLFHDTQHITRYRGYFDRFILWYFFNSKEIKNPVFIKKES